MVRVGPPYWEIYSANQAFEWYKTHLDWIKYKKVVVDQSCLVRSREVIQYKRGSLIEIWHFLKLTVGGLIAVNQRSRSLSFSALKSNSTCLPLAFWNKTHESKWAFLPLPKAEVTPGGTRKLFNSKGSKKKNKLNYNF